MLKSVSAGNSENQFTVRITDESGNDVTENYLPTLIYGTLTVTKRTITVSSPSANKIYDGTALTNNETTILMGSVAEGETAVIAVTGTQTGAGTSKNEFTIAIYAADGRDVTENYAVTSGFGSLTVLPRSLTLLSSSATKVYDGTPLVNETVTLVEGTVADGQNADIRTTGTITDVGSAENTYVICITDATGNDVTANYSIEFACGTLTVTPREITIRTEDAAKIYDGTPLVNETVTITTGSVAEGQTAELYTTGTITNVGSAENTYMPSRPA